jgi:hypothetical protein
MYFDPIGQGSMILKGIIFPIKKIFTWIGMDLQNS